MAYSEFTLEKLNSGENRFTPEQLLSSTSIWCRCGDMCVCQKNLDEVKKKDEAGYDHYDKKDNWIALYILVLGLML